MRRRERESEGKSVLEKSREKERQPLEGEREKGSRNW